MTKAQMKKYAVIAGVSVASVLVYQNFVQPKVPKLPAIK